ncbi:TlpA family protein disulfide reductase, partial [Polaribacter sp. DS7-9]|nr:TlpA family protein disulfide reductase [Polaribacter sp. DS7-9]
KEKRNLHYFYLARINEYEMAHRYFTKDQTFKVSEGFLKDFDGFDYNNEADFKFSNNYKELVTNHYVKQANERATTESIERDLAFVKTVQEVQSATIKNTLL